MKLGRRRRRQEPTHSLLGIVADVSGSMNQSSKPAADANGENFHTFVKALDSLRADLSPDVDGYQQESGVHVSVFVYAFGLRGGKGGGFVSSIAHAMIDSNNESIYKPAFHAFVDGMTRGYRQGRGKNDYAPIACDVLSVLTVLCAAIPQPPAPSPSVPLTASALVPRTRGAVARQPSGRADLPDLAEIARAHGRDGWEVIAAEFLPDPEQVARMVRRLRKDEELSAALAKLTPVLNREELALVLDQVRAGSLRERGTKLREGAGVAAMAAIRHLPNLTTTTAHLRLVRDAMIQLAAPDSSDISTADLLARLRVTAAPLMFDTAERIGDTTMSLPELVRLLEVTDGRRSTLEDLIYGKTPMRQALGVAADRFARELQQAPKQTRPTMLLITDGLSTDGSPTSAFQRLHELGVSIAVCYLTDQDLDLPNVVFGRPRDTWSDAARQLFDGATPVKPDDPFGQTLAAAGWTIEPGARYFFQGNHSDTVARIIRLASQTAP